MTSIIDFFDVRNTDHLKEWKHLCTKGSWPINGVFASSDIEYAANWQ